MKKKKRGVITFEWIVLFSLLLVGIIGAVASIRDSLIIETTEVADAILHNNKSYIISPSAEVQVSYDGRGDEIIYTMPSFSAGSHYIEPFIPGNSHRVFLDLEENPGG
ncbi:MAG: hypothetical protein Q4A17_11475 [Thermoguttaceae bacterium]|nr:hypothetical protein [Thermoguttaceae bacterium]MDO4858552.1 hypothetical protein [Thermoguttaceae bacterium]